MRLTRMFHLMLLAGLTSIAWGQQITVTPEGGSAVTLNAADLAKMNHISAIVLEDAQLVNYSGVLLSDVLKQAGSPIAAVKGLEPVGLVIAQGKDGKKVGFSYGELDPDVGGSAVMIVDQISGKPLTGAHGPFRLVVKTDRSNTRFIDNVVAFSLVHVDK